MSEFIWLVKSYTEPVVPTTEPNMPSSSWPIPCNGKRYDQSKIVQEEACQKSLQNNIIYLDLSLIYVSNLEGFTLED